MLRVLMAGVALLTVFASGAAVAAPPKAPEGLAIATFGAGCYWCVERDFDGVKGVVETTPGFMGGTYKNPTYDEVSTGLTGHTEVVNVTYDPKIVTYKELLKTYWRLVDFVDRRGQFCDRGNQYRPAIFVYSDEQKTQAEASKQKIAELFRVKVVVEVSKAADFTAAPDPDFYKKHPLYYLYYRAGCGRDSRTAQLWSAIDQSEFAGF